MKFVQCKRCGSSEFEEKNGYMVCKFCNASFQKYAEDGGMKNTSIEVSEDVRRLLEKCNKEPWNAKRYAKLILDIDPTNREVFKYL